MAETKAKTRENERILTRGELVQYGAGGVAGTMGDTMKGQFTLPFLSNVAGVDIAVAGVIMMFMTIWDAINDPIIGGIADRTETRLGKYRPHLIMAGFGLSITLVAMFLVPPLGGAAQVAYYTVVLALYSVFFTQFVVPLQALNTVVTPYSDERNVLLSSRQFTGFISGGVVAMIAIPIVTAVSGHEWGAGGWAVVALVVAAFTIATAFMCANGVKRFDRRGTLPTPPRLPIGEQIRIILKNRAVLCVCGMFGMVSLNYSLTNAISAYYLDIVAGNVGLISVQAAAALVISLVVIPLMPGGLRRFNKLPLLVIGVVVNLLPSVALIFLGTGATGTQIIVLYGVGVVGFTMANLTCLSLVPDVVDYTTLHYDSTQAGLISAVVNFFRKFFASFSTFIVGGLLGAAGYDANPTGQAVVDQIMVIKIVLPIVIGVCCLVFARLYPISGKMQKELQETMGGRREAQSESGGETKLDGEDDQHE